MLFRSMTGVKHPRGTQLTIELISWDEIDLSVQARLLEVSNVIEEVDENLQFEGGDSAAEADQIDDQLNDQRADSLETATGLPIVTDSVVLSTPPSSP